jgi:hypothetical protein
MLIRRHGREVVRACTRAFDGRWMRRVVLILAAPLVLAIVLRPGGTHIPLDP